MNHKRSDYNKWLRGYVSPMGNKVSKCGFYDLIKKLLNEEKWTATNLPQVRMVVVHEEEMDDFQADRMEGYFQKVVYPKCLNVQIGDGHGKAGGTNKDNFGSVSWHKHEKKFQAVYSGPTSSSAKRTRGGQRKQNQVSKRFHTIEEAHSFIFMKWTELKDEPNFIGYRDPKPIEHYRTHLANKYEELVFLLD